ncbi:FUSC family protein [Variovorax guangxiensis]|uniref:FUSC family protein n=1 Tax=Variovorax guangxiensis TaxID=1775474 RepID=UPI0028565440|nr:FUSC family protein [Variovorax guangxiensis]MDR6858502.1 putative membrane protein YccC [Variovorax guangxiensis]
MSVLTSRGIVYAFNCTVAALLALSVAFIAGLPNPWWAALTVFITSQPMAGASGAVASRALHRLGGTALGVGASLLILPALVHVPELMIAAIAAWLALFVYLSLLDRSARSYMFVLAGYTVALVGLPLAGDTSQLFDTAVLRVEEILIGTLSATVVHSVFFPRSIKSQMDAKLNAILKDARGWMLAALAPEPAPAAEQAARKRMAADLGELHQLALGQRFDAGAGNADARVVSALEERLVSLLPLWSGVEDRLRAIAKQGAMPQALSLQVAELRAWIGEAQVSDPQRVEQLLAARRQALPASGTAPQWTEMLAASLVQRLAELVRAWDEMLHLLAFVRDPGRAPDASLQQMIDAQGKRRLHLDRGLAAYAGLAAGIAVLLAGGLVIAIGWQQGAAVVGIAATGSAVFAFADDARPMQKLFVAATLAAAPVAALYLFAILPLVDGFGTLALVMVPLYFGTALFLGTPKYWLHAYGFALTSQTMISLQPAYRADFDSFITIFLGPLAGAVIALLVTSLMRVLSAETSAWRILRAGWRDLAALADASPRQGRRDWASRMLDRAGLLLPRLARAGGAEGLRHADALDDLRLGVNVADLLEVARQCGGTVAQAAEAALRRVADHFRGRILHGPVAPGAELLKAVDLTIHRLLGLQAGELRLRGLAAATGLRVGLFPDAPPYRSEERATC